MNISVVCIYNKIYITKHTCDNLERVLLVNPLTLNSQTAGCSYLLINCRLGLINYRHS